MDTTSMPIQQNITIYLNVQTYCFINYRTKVPKLYSYNI